MRIAVEFVRRVWVEVEADSLDDNVEEKAELELMRRWEDAHDPAEFWPEHEIASVEILGN